jgi:hypothetical protein
MPRAGFEPGITASDPSNTVHVLDRSATATGTADITGLNGTKALRVE